MTTGPGDWTAAAAVAGDGDGDGAAAAGGLSRGGLRASDADREQVVRTLKDAYVQGRLTEDELGERADRVYATRTYAELAEATAAVTADLPADLGAGRTGAQPSRDPWRATKIAWRIEYAVFLPGIVAFLLLPGGPHTSVAEVVILASVVYLIFWVLGVAMMVSTRSAKRSGGHP